MTRQSEEEDLLRGREGLHGGLQRCLVVLERDLSAGRRGELPPPDELAQGIHHVGQALLVCKGRRELAPSCIPRCAGAIDCPWANTRLKPFRVPGMPGCDGLPAQARGMGKEPPAWWHTTVPARATPPSACVSAALRTISIHDTSKNKGDGTGVAVWHPSPC